MLVVEGGGFPGIIMERSWHSNGGYSGAPKKYTMSESVLLQILPQFFNLKSIKIVLWL